MHTRTQSHTQIHHHNPIPQQMVQSTLISTPIGTVQQIPGGGQILGGAVHYVPAYQPYQQFVTHQGMQMSGPEMNHPNMDGSAYLQSNLIQSPYIPPVPVMNVGMSLGMGMTAVPYTTVTTNLAQFTPVKGKRNWKITRGTPRM